MSSKTCIRRNHPGYRRAGFTDYEPGGVFQRRLSGGGRIKASGGPVGVFSGGGAPMVGVREGGKYHHRKKRICAFTGDSP